MTSAVPTDHATQECDHRGAGDAPRERPDATQNAQGGRAARRRRRAQNQPDPDQDRPDQDRPDQDRHAQDWDAQDWDAQD